MAYNAPNLADALLNRKYDSLIRRSQAASNPAESLNATQASDTLTPSVTTLSPSSVASAPVTSAPSTSSSTTSQVSQISATSAPSLPFIPSSEESSLTTSTTSASLSSVSLGAQIQTEESSQFTATSQSSTVSNFVDSVSTPSLSALSSTSTQSPLLTASSTGTLTDVTSSVAGTLPAGSGDPTSQGSQNTGSGDTQTAMPGPSHRNTLPIILGVTLGTVALIILLVVFLFLRQRKLRTRQVAALQWDPVLDYIDDTPPQSPMSSDSGHGLIRMQIIPNSLDDHIHSHWVNQAHTSAHTPIVSESLAPAPAESRGSSPGGMSTVSTVSTVTFARPIVSVDIQDNNTINSTGHYTPSGSEC